MRQAIVKVHDQEAGILTETDDRHYRFAYHAGYSGAPVSLTMPITEGVEYRRICFAIVGKKAQTQL